MEKINQAECNNKDIPLPSAPHTAQFIKCIMPAQTFYCHTSPRNIIVVGTKWELPPSSALLCAHPLGHLIDHSSHSTYCTGYGYLGGLISSRLRQIVNGSRSPEYVSNKQLSRVTACLPFVLSLFTKISSRNWVQIIPPSLVQDVTVDVLAQLRCWTADSKSLI